MKYTPLRLLSQTGLEVDERRSGCGSWRSGVQKLHACVSLQRCGNVVPPERSGSESTRGEKIKAHKYVYLTNKAQTRQVEKNKKPKDRNTSHYL